MPRNILDLSRLQELFHINNNQYQQLHMFLTQHFLTIHYILPVPISHKCLFNFKTNYFKNENYNLKIIKILIKIILIKIILIKK